MTKEKILAYLQRERPYLNINAVGKTCGVPNLHAVLEGKKDSKGYDVKLADKHLPLLTEWLKSHRKA